MIYDLRLMICRSRREETLTDCGVQRALNRAKRLECVVFSDAFRATAPTRTVSIARAKAVLKPPQSKRFATAHKPLSRVAGNFSERKTV